jgi:predicted DsbA family dithiol-disulfide isomerase
MKIELWSDFACPFCYIGKKRFESALNNFPHKDQVEVIYKLRILQKDITCLFLKQKKDLLCSNNKHKQLD